MIKKTFTLANRSKAFVMATLITVTGMYSVQAQKSVEILDAELTTQIKASRGIIANLTFEKSKAGVINKKNEIIQALANIETKTTEFSKAVPRTVLCKNAMDQSTLRLLTLTIPSDIDTAKEALKRTCRQINIELARANNMSEIQVIAKMITDIEGWGNEAEQTFRNIVSTLDKPGLLENVLGYGKAKALNEEAKKNKVGSAKSPSSEGTVAPKALPMWKKALIKTLIAVPTIGSVMLAVGLTGLAGLQLGFFNMNGQPTDDNRMRFAQAYNACELILKNGTETAIASCITNMPK